MMEKIIDYLVLLCAAWIIVAAIILRMLSIRMDESKEPRFSNARDSWI